jgi:methyl-accepting chemotaxis protein
VNNVSPANRQVRPLRPAARPAPAPDRSIRFGMLGKTMVTMLGAGLLPLALFAGIMLFDQAGRIRKEAEVSMRANAEHVTDQVDEWLDKNVRALQQAANAPGMATMHADDQLKTLAALQKAHPWMYLTFTIALDGRNIARNDGKPLVDYSDRVYYKDILNGKELAWEVVISKTNHKPALLLSVPIKQDGALVGVMAGGMAIEDISHIIAKLKIGETGRAFLVDDHAKVVAHPREEFVQTQRVLDDHPLVQAFLADRQPHTLSFLQRNDAKPVLGAVQGNRWGWAVVVQQEEAELFAPLRHMVEVAVILLAGSAVLLAAIAWAFSRKLVRPILDMASEADAMSMGELERPMPVSRRDEIGVLGRSLERLRRSMKAAMDRIESVG